MENNKELSALFLLLDDPDEEVFDAVSQKIVDYGKHPTNKHRNELNC